MIDFLRRLLGSRPSDRVARDKIRSEATDRATSTLSEIASLRRQREIASAEAQYAARIKGKTLPMHR